MAKLTLACHRAQEISDRMYVRKRNYIFNTIKTCF